MPRKTSVSLLVDRQSFGMVSRLISENRKDLVTEWTSLFAQKLRRYRACCGEHGRMTQEELALALEVSVDAISKYERSLSYIRGDLENRLVTVLGWSKDEVVACREDWETGRQKSLRPTYRLLSNQEVIAEFSGSGSAVTEAVAKLETDCSQDLPSGFSAADTVWRDVQNEGFLFGPYVMFGSEMVGHVGLVFPNAALEKCFRDCRFDEGELIPAQLKRPILPGEYFAYCPAIYIARGHEAAGRLLLSGFVEQLESLADREIFVREIGGISVNALGRQLCEDLGLRFRGNHRLYREFGVWILPGQRVGSSILGRRSSKLRHLYGRRFQAT